MTLIYEVAGISKQALHQQRLRRLQRAQEAYEFFEQADKIRKEHPGAGCRTMAKDLSCKGWGRDKLEALLLGNGYRLYYPRNYTRTTYSQSDFNYPNLIEGLELNHINQVIQTDITYFRAGQKFYYIVFILDVYSRRIVGYAASKTMEASGNIKALKMLLKIRRGYNLKGMIHHSDKGRQHIDFDYRQLLAQHEIIPSMCGAAWENAYTERINRTIKNDYLYRWKIADYPSLVKALRLAVNHYNTKRKHSSLNGLSPIEFENMVENLPIDLRPKCKIYKHLESCSQLDCEN